ncbi:MIP transporter [Aspergillus nomiae NRRL 13137]|uniref:MIP transporter n=1 Tax=Aspergillus nomiae NRRL (strain ATCC 15546 / NRRL 13137 / CBS 260.88 / M93) TaxID=1509407 RepID=A0A0L1IYX6_ASPN3|nr:MIP transporter [Aspergillus nomiae NRRL 13137]KNG84714.1 MIP transporter [Aspergillus nomiae NRRL 13137]
MDTTTFPESANMPRPMPVIQPFAGRIGGNQALVVDRHDPSNADLLKKTPDAAPLMTVREGFDLRGFWDIDLWKFGFVECMGTMMMVFVTSWMAIRPPSASANVTPTSPAGVYSTAAFLGPIFGGLSNWMFLTLFIFSFSNVSGSHLNPTITLATFFARLISLPRMVIYLLGQTLGGALAGFMLRSAYGSRDFTVGGCSVNTSLVPVDEAFLLEFIFSLVLIFLSFGVGLDPRQGSIYGAALSPFLVGMTLGVLSWGSSFSRAGYAGASLNPARCFGVYVATSYPGYHWIHWVGPLVASVGHGIVYFIAPPWGH